MNPALLHTNIQEYIDAHLDADITKLLLKNPYFNSTNIQEVVEQIEAKKRCKTKLPTWYTTKEIYYPNKLNIEQTSSEATAKYKSECISGNTIIDITGGLGVDSVYFSKVFKSVIHCEIDAKLSKIATHNFDVLSIDNIKTVNKDGIEYIKNTKDTLDWIYADPSRRHDIKGKVFFLKDCLPNIPDTIDLIFDHTKNVLLKTSPMLDITQGISELKFVKSVHCIAVNNDVKEVLYHLEQGYSDDIEIKTINFSKDRTQQFTFKKNEESLAEVQYDVPKKYLYEPNAAILKSGAFNSISEKLSIYKLHKHSHLYTSDELIEFPGRRFLIEQVISYNRKSIKSQLSNNKVNISARNFPNTTDQIRKIFKLKDGGNLYAFFTTDYANKKVVILTSKI